MAYNSIISRNDASGLIPEEVSREIIESVVGQSVVLRMGRRLPNLSAAQQKLPVLSTLPEAYFVAEGSLKQTSSAAWASRYIVAEELAVIIPVPEAVLDDAAYDIWGQVKPRIVEAFGRAIDRAVLSGTGIPASWQTNMGGAGILGAAPASHKLDKSTLEGAGKDLYDILLGAGGLWSLVEEDGFRVNGAVAAPVMQGYLRSLRATDKTPIFLPSMQEPGRYVIHGVPVEFPVNGAIDPSSMLMVAGDFTNLVYAIRQDISYKVLTESVITDETGAIVYNLAQQDMVALRAVMRLGVALPNPVTALNTDSATRFPFAVLVP